MMRPSNSGMATPTPRPVGPGRRRWHPTRRSTGWTDGAWRTGTPSAARCGTSQSPVVAVPGPAHGQHGGDQGVDPVGAAAPAPRPGRRGDRAAASSSTRPGRRPPAVSSARHRSATNCVFPATRCGGRRRRRPGAVPSLAVGLPSRRRPTPRPGARPRAARSRSRRAAPCRPRTARAARRCPARRRRGSGGPRRRCRRARWTAGSARRRARPRHPPPPAGSAGRGTLAQGVERPSSQRCARPAAG